MVNAILKQPAKPPNKTSHREERIACIICFPKTFDGSTRGVHYM